VLGGVRIEVKLDEDEEDPLEQKMECGEWGERTPESSKNMAEEVQRVRGVIQTQLMAMMARKPFDI